MTATTMPMKWSDDCVQDDTCACCGRVLGSKFKWVEIVDGGASVGSPEVEWDTNAPDYMGLFKVGSTCAKKRFNGFYHEM